VFGAEGTGDDNRPDASLVHSLDPADHTHSCRKTAATRSTPLAFEMRAYRGAP
jgi:hypothetical protein